ncbi:MAG: phosphoribosylanthranilate isomerase [Nitrospinota bacterium]|nr:phosphoribosylanthranilate isomerase [Nitrospinota bacterium]
MSKIKSPVKIKVCGITNLADALMAVQWGADALGFIFYKKSPRSVAPRKVKSIVATLPPFVNRVGVFVNEPAERVNRIADTCNLDYIQLHGEEKPSYCKKIKRKIIKAARLRTSSSLKELDDYNVEGFLLDSYSEKQLGGTGETCDWTLARDAKKYGTIILAGGLNPKNVVNAILRVRPYGIDVCSGVEKSPGKKDPAKIKAFFTAVAGG